VTGPATADPLTRALDRAAGGRAIPGNAVRPLVDGPEIFPVIEEVIERATRWIHFENYIVRHDAVGMRFADRLIAAAARGVQVRVLYDSVGSLGTRRRFWRRLRTAGVEVRAFGPLNPLRPLRAFRRNHRKYVAADGLRAVMGGFCFGDEWAGNPARGVAPWRDTGAEIVGPAVPALEQAFLRVWKAGGGEPPAYQPPPVAAERGGVAVRVVEGIPGRWRMARVTQLLAAAAAERIWITEPYLVAPLPETEALASAARDGVDVRLLLPGRSDLPAIRALTRVGYRALLKAGVPGNGGARWSTPRPPWWTTAGSRWGRPTSTPRAWAPTTSSTCWRRGATWPFRPPPGSSGTWRRPWRSCCGSGPWPAACRPWSPRPRRCGVRWPPAGASCRAGRW
jgi:cardiolipin synthase